MKARFLMAVAWLLVHCAGRVEPGTDGEVGGSGASSTGGEASGGRGMGGAAGGTTSDPTGGTAGGGGTGGSGASGGGGGAAGAGSGGSPEAVGCAEPALDIRDITSQAELEAFAALGCEVFEGTLRIGAEDLVDLQALSPSPLRVITGSLYLQNNPALENVDGLLGLEEIHSSLVISGNAALTNLAGLSTLASVGGVGGTLVVQGNAALISIEALGQAEIHAGLNVVSNALLPSLDGLQGLLGGGVVTVAENAGLVTLGLGLSALASCTACTFSGNAQLGSLSLPSLEAASALSITSHAALSSVDLPELATVESALTIAANSVLESLGGLPSLTHVGSLTIAANSNYPQCLVDELAERFQVACSCGGNDDAASCE